MARYFASIELEIEADDYDDAYALSDELAADVAKHPSVVHSWSGDAEEDTRVTASDSILS